MEKKTKNQLKNQKKREFQAKKKWLAGLLVNKKVVISLLRFLKMTEIVIKEKARERKEEWKQKKN